MFAVSGLLNFDAPHGIPLITASFHSFENSSFAGVILRQLDFFQQLLAKMDSVIWPLKKSR